MPAPTTTKAARTRTRILDAAAATLAEQGYAGASLTRIAAESGLKAGSLYFHFDSKDALVGEVLREGVARTEAHVRARLDALDADARPATRLATAIAAHVELLHELGDYAVAVTRVIDDVPPAVRLRHNRRNRAYGELWLELLYAARGAGAIADVDPRIARRLLYAAMNGAAHARGVPHIELTATLVALLGLNPRRR